ncbi:MAG: immunoglobulin-like domain-containing protein [Campylobacterota bacterium]|nr:immunoglobulin-like domain-containing protein [Campylobacterota bacterium]
MAQTVGYVTESNGVFFAKDTNGDARVLKVGDELLFDETIVGDNANSDSDLIKFTVDGADQEYTLFANEQLLLDNDLLSPQLDIENLEKTAAAGDAEVDALTGRFIDRTGDETDVTTTLRDATFTDPVFVEEDSVAEPIPEDTKVEPILEDAVLTLSATPQLTEDGGVITYTATLDLPANETMTVTLSNGEKITIEAGKTKGIATVTIKESQFEDVYKDSDTISVSIIETTDGGFATVDHTTNGSASTLIVDTIDTTNVWLSGPTAVAEGAIAAYTVNVDHAPQNTPLEVKVKVSHLDTDNNDLMPFTQIVVIPVGVKSVEFTVANSDDNTYEGNENYRVELTGDYSGGNYENAIVDTSYVDTTIIDNDTELPPLDHAISNVTYFLVNSLGNAIEVKLDNWSGEIKNPAYPSSLNNDVVSEITTLTGDNSYDVVGYAIKAGNDPVMVIGEQPEGTDTAWNTNDVVYNFNTSTGEMTLNPSDTTMIVGTDFDNGLEGGAKGEVIYGKDGDDEIESKGGDDIIYGGTGSDDIDAGTGDDNIVYDQNDTNINGGEGNDTLIVDNSSLLDFSTLANNNVTNIENVDLRSGSGVEVTNLTIDSVLQMTDDTKTLYIYGDNEDSVKLTNEPGSTDIWIEGTQYTDNDGVVFDTYTTTDSTVTVYVQGQVYDEIV